MFCATAKISGSPGAPRDQANHAHGAQMQNCLATRLESAPMVSPGSVMLNDFGYSSRHRTILLNV
jgi:hypothetical protein